MAEPFCRPEQALAAARRALAIGGVVLIDGRSGSGKTVFASSLAAATGARVLRLDDVYPGWDGLDAGAEAMVRALVARSRGVTAPLRRWDWRRSTAADAFPVPVCGPLVVEGCGAIRAGSTPLADLSLWLELDTATRRERALARDGDTYRPHWDRWAVQETRAIARDRPALRADLRVDARWHPGDHRRTFSTVSG